MKVNAVILNYNDADTVETLVRSICGYEVLEYIILVDNHSQDDSRQKLQQLACEHEKIQLVFLEENGGYGKGNNALVTAKTDADETFFLQLDEETTCSKISVYSLNS